MNVLYVCVQSWSWSRCGMEGGGRGRKGSCRKPQMSSSARGNLKLKLKPRLKLQLKLQMKLTLELRFDLKFWAHRLLRHPVPAPAPCACSRKDSS